jgi:transcription initiation factor TFIIIB Brf1 subunit/transcription initiation factor TFIIB
MGLDSQNISVSISVLDSKCPGCSGAFLDVGDELVCGTCGVVSEKEVLEVPFVRKTSAMDLTRQSLGGFLGSAGSRQGERHPRALPGSVSTYEYLKLVSDFAGREDDLEYSCARMIERVCEKLSLPGYVVTESVSIMKKTLHLKRGGHRITTAAISAFSIANACKVEGVASVTLREIVDTHRALGRRVRMSAIMELTMESDIKLPARKPEDYLGRVLAKLASHPKVSARLRAAGVMETPYFNGLREEASLLIRSVPVQDKEGHGPCALAATSLYAAEVRISGTEKRKRRITQKEAADCGDTAEYTIRDQFREIFVPLLAVRPKIGEPALLLQLVE